MPMTELEELRTLLGQPLPGGRGFQATREKRIQHLHEAVVNTLLQSVTDTYSQRELAEMYLEAHFGDEFGRPRLVLSKEFQELWADFHPDDEDTLVNEAPDARKQGDSFTPNTDLYGKAIFVYDANDDRKDAPPLVGTLKEIKGMHTYLIEIDGENDIWEVDSVDDLEITEDGQLNLWNAWK